MQATFGGYQVQDARQALTTLAQLRFPAPKYADRMNSLSIPLGQAPARGWILLLRDTLNKLNLNGLHTLALKDDQNAFTFQNLVLTSIECLTPGNEDDKTALYLCEIADRTWLVHNPLFSFPINKLYNVRAPAFGGAYYEDSLNAGVAWTWAQMVADIWNLMGSTLSTAPGLPITPDGTPEGFVFIGMSAWEALNVVLDRIGCAVSRNLQNAASTQYGIVQVGAADAVTSDRFDSLDRSGRKIYDRDYLEMVRARVPYGVRVFFHKLASDYGTEQTTPRTTGTQWMGVAVHTVDVVGPDSSTAEANVYHPIWDDLPALVDAAGTVTNSAACSTRATERANDYYRRLRGDGGERMVRIYTGLASFNPGEIIRGVTFRQDLQGIRFPENAGGWITEVVRHPYPSLLRVADDGRWAPVGEAKDSARLRPPDFRPTVPNYPHLFQKIRLTTGTADGNGNFTAFVQQYDPSSRTWADKEACYARDHNGSTTLTTNRRYDGRLSGYETDRPIYTVSAGSGTTNLTVEELDGSPSYTFTEKIIVDQTDGLSLSQPAANQARIDLASASQTQKGAVDTTTQTFAGDKTFYNTVTVNSSGGAGTALTVTGPSVLNNTPNQALTVLGTSTFSMLASFASGINAVGWVYLGNSTSRFPNIVGADGATYGGIDLVCGPNTSGTATVRIWSGGTTAQVLVINTNGGSPSGEYAIDRNGTVYTGADGTDSIGNVFKGGLCITVGSASVVTWGGSGTITGTWTIGSGGSVKGSQSTDGATGQLVMPVKTTTSAPSTTAQDEGAMVWNSNDDRMYVKKASAGNAGWEEVTTRPQVVVSIKAASQFGMQ